MHLFDALLAAESVQAIFEPVMIPGHYEEQQEAACEYGVAEQGPSQFVWNDGAEESSGKNCETPGGEPLADTAAIRFYSCQAAQHSHQTLFSRRQIS